VSVLATLVPLQATVFLLAALGALAVVLTRDPVRQVVVNGIYGWILVAVFMVLQAPDVALSMLVVSSVAFPLVVLIAITRVQAGDSRRRDREDD
jgi:energy-converting hydrogenase B subunit D